MTSDEEKDLLSDRVQLRENLKTLTGRVGAMELEIRTFKSLLIAAKITDAFKYRQALLAEKAISPL
jgi:hypothetical protein